MSEKRHTSFSLIFMMVLTVSIMSGISVLGQQMLKPLPVFLQDKLAAKRVAINSVDDGSAYNTIILGKWYFVM
jgi:hypothetical protein